MITVRTFGSSSAGNCYVIDDGQTQLILEAGVNFKKVKQGMDFDFSRVAGLLISHEHGDHSKEIKKFIDQTDVPIYASAGTLNALRIDDYRGHVMQELKSYKVGSWFITGFEVEHDAAEPMGFLCDSTNNRLLFMTDTYYCKYNFKQVNYMMVEMNYEYDYVRERVGQDSFNEGRESRLLLSHFSMNNSLDFIKNNMSRDLKEVWLIHLSEMNANPELFKHKVQELTGVPVHIAGG